MFALLRPLRIALPLVVAATVLAGCLAPTAQDALDVTAPHAGFEHRWRDYPQMDARFERTGLVRTPGQMAAITLGQSRAAVERQLGAPYRLHEGAAEYNISLPLTRRDRIICQFMVQYDQDETVQATLWRRPQCTDIARSAK